MIGHRNFPAASYDRWKTRSPDDDAPTCVECGAVVPRDVGSICDDCLNEIAAEEAMVDFYRWEPWA